MFPGLGQDQQWSQQARTLLRDVRGLSRGMCHVETNVGVSAQLDAPGDYTKGRKDKLEELAFSQFAPFSSLFAWRPWLPDLRSSRSYSQGSKGREGGES